MSEDTNTLQLKAFEALKENLNRVEKEGNDSRHETKQSIERIDKELDKYEEENQKKFAEYKEALNKADEEKKALEELQKQDKEILEAYKERLEAIELALAKGGQPAQGASREVYEKSEEKQMFIDYLKSGDQTIIKQHRAYVEKNLMRTDVNVDGGFLVPHIMDTEIRKNIIEISNMRSICRVRTIAGKSLEIPKRTSIMESFYEGEAEDAEQGNAKYESTTVTPFRQTVQVLITEDMLMDSAFNMEGQMSSDVSISFAQKEGKLFILGSNIKQPEGFVTNADIQATATVSSVTGGFSADDIFTLQGSLKIGYNPTFVLNRRTLADIRKFKGTDGQYLWQPGLNGAPANTLSGDPYLIAEDMPDNGSNAVYPLAYGDFMRGYEIFDRTGMTVIRDIYTQASGAITVFTFRRWNTGRVILPEAIKLLKTGGS